MIVAQLQAAFPCGGGGSGGMDWGTLAIGAGLVAGAIGVGLLTGGLGDLAGGLGGVLGLL